MQTSNSVKTRKNCKLQRIPPETNALSKNVDLDLLVVNDQLDFRQSASRYLKRMGIRVVEATCGEEALNLTDKKNFDVVILDIHISDMNGIEVLKKLRERDPMPKVIMLAGGGTIANAVDSIKLGAYDFITKPVQLDNLFRAVVLASEKKQLEKENAQLKVVLHRHEKRPNFVGDSPAMQEIFRVIERTAASDKPVLIQGESGTGKELVARAIHQSSPLADKPLFVINGAALAEHLLDSELFGHEKGAFTGAVAAKPGLFEIADGSTLFIDEFGEMSGALQAKLLRVLEDGTMRRVGSITQRKVKVRVIAATNSDLEKDVREKKFREDLYYRMNVLAIKIPPLRMRNGDIRQLVKAFTGDDWSVDDDVMKKFINYSWPGNVRQLQNAIERAKVLADENRIELANIPQAIAESDFKEITENANLSDLDLESLNQLHVLQAYQRCSKNKTKTAKSLGINRRSLYRLLEKYSIE